MLGPMPPYRVYRGFLDSEAHARLLAYALENEEQFRPSLLYGERLDPSLRRSLRSEDLGPLEAEFRRRILDLAPTLVAELRVTPFALSRVELELIAHGDGAYFKRHIDTHVGVAPELTSDRVLSAVYYFHGEPRAFAGGGLRLYQFGAVEGKGNFIELPPDQNVLLAFPSWVEHEVLEVSVPSRRFADSRFAVNCWMHRARTGREA